MGFYKITIIIFLIIFLMSAAFVKKFDFFRNIPAAAFLNIFNPVKETAKANKHLSVNHVKGIYSTVWTAKSKRINDLIKIADETEINAIVIDVKDKGIFLDDYIKNLINELHKKNIYAIARIAVFQDSSQIKTHPDWYFKTYNGDLWQDGRGWYWIDPSHHEVWEYNLAVAKQAIDVGFDELNFDYVRYPAFSKTDNVMFPPQDKIIVKSNIINNFADYLTSKLKKYDPEIILSVDLFAYNMLKKDDLGVGQNFKNLYDYFDYISPMIYPSHYISGNFGFDNPAEHPYEVVLGTIETGKNQLREKIIFENGTSTPSLIDPILKKEIKKMRPWLQDFNIGTIYNGEMIRKEKRAVYDAGLTSGWLLWNPRNVYTRTALDSK